MQSIKRRMSGLPADVARKLREKAYSLGTSAESAVAIRRNNGTSSNELLNFPFGQRVGLINPTMILRKISDENFENLVQTLKGCGAKFWTLQVEPHRNATVNLLGADFEKFVVQLAAIQAHDLWYCQALAADGQTTGPIRLLSSVQKNISSSAGIRIWRYVSPLKNSTFFAGEPEGVDIVRWETAEIASLVTSAVWNSKCVQLPHPEARSEEFETALADANLAEGHFCNFPVDAVITWVDGEDPAWKERKNKALGLDKTTLIQDATDDARFEPLDELRFCLRSIEQYAPWIRTIYLVTDRQIPKWLNQDTGSRLKVVDHREIWSEPEQLPVFNSHAIEANLHRIVGLSEHFLYLNDDMILTAPVTPDTFFYSSEISKVFYSRALVDFANVSAEDNVSTVAAKNARQVLSGDGLPAMNRKFFHTPYPLRRSVIEEIEHKYPQLFRMTSSAKFRSLSDVALAGSFYFNYALATGHAAPGKINYDYIDPADSQALSRLRRIIQQRNTQCVVVNDGSQIVAKSERERLKRLIPKLLEKLLPVPSSFEK